MRPSTTSLVSVLERAEVVVIVHLHVTVELIRSLADARKVGGSHTERTWYHHGTAGIARVVESRARLKRQDRATNDGGYPVAVFVLSGSPRAVVTV